MAKKKNKYPETREFQSVANQERRVITHVYMSDPEVKIVLKGNYPDNVLKDLQHAIDDVLKYHGL